MRRSAVPKAKLRAVSRSQLRSSLSLGLFPSAAVADILGEGDKLVVGLVA